MKLLVIFFLGLGILIGAIVLNAVASKIGVVSWYEFLKNPGKTSWPSYIWLFVVYPFSLGAIAYLIAKFLKI